MVISDTAEGWIENPEWINVATVKAWLAQHHASFDAFVEDNGESEAYRSDVVFAWLGY